MPKRKRKFRKYFVVVEGELEVVGLGFFDDINTRTIALGIAADTYLALNAQLYEDAIEEGDMYINSIKVTDGLMRSLDELDSRFPFLMHQVRSLNLHKKITIYIS